MKRVLPSVQSCFACRLMQIIYTNHSRWFCAEMVQGRNCCSVFYRQTPLYLCSYVVHNYKFLASFCSSVCIITSNKSDMEFRKYGGEVDVWSSSPFHRQLRDGWCCKSHTQIQLSQVLAFRPSYLDIPPWPLMTPHCKVVQNKLYS